MRGLADPDSRIYSLLNKLILTAELNLLVVLCSLPVVTAGAALSSMHGLLLAAVLGLLYLDWALIFQSRYVYTVPQCLKNALLAWIQYPGSIVVYLISLVIPGLFCLTLETMPLILLGGITLPHFISTTLYSPVFDKLEGLPPRMPKL